MASERERERAVHFCTLETAGEQSLKNATAYEKLNTAEHRAEICNRVALVIRRERYGTAGKLLPLERPHYRWCGEQHGNKSNVFLDNAANISANV